jgi:phosphatidylserine decarboxylase
LTNRINLFLSLSFGLTLFGSSLTWTVPKHSTNRPNSVRFSIFKTRKSVSLGLPPRQNRFLTEHRATVAPIETVESTWQGNLHKRVEEFQDHVACSPDFKTNLEYSLKKADSNARSMLDPKLYKAFLLDGAPRWPTNVNKAVMMARKRTPRVLPPPTRKCMISSATSTTWWISLSDGRIVENDPWFAKWVVDYVNVWGEFCDPTDSISPETIYCFHKRSPPNFNITDSMIPWNKEDYPDDGRFPPYTIFNSKREPLRPNSPSGWLTWNQMFARELNVGLRPAVAPADNTVINSPADCTYCAHYAIDQNGNLPESVVIKQTHEYANVPDLLNISQYAHAFDNGTFVHFFLGPYSYHRFHTPVDGVIKECFPVVGRNYLDVKVTDGQFEAPANSEDGYEFTQARGAITIDTTHSPAGNVGVIAVVPVGMSQVSSVRMIAQPGVSVPKGTEFGYFLFGGSTSLFSFRKVYKKLTTNGNLYNFIGAQIAQANAEC